MKLKKGLIVCSVALMTGLMTGCSSPNSFYFDFSKFLLNETTVEEEVKLEGLNLDQSIITKDKILAITKNVEELFKVLADKEYYYSNFNNKSKYFNGVRYLLSEDYYNKVSQGEIKSTIKKSIDDIYYNEYTQFKEANVIAVEQSLEGIKCYVEIVSVNDDVLFNCQTVVLNLDNNLKLLSDEMVTEITSSTNTIRELGEDSLLQTSHNEFKQSLSKLLSSLTNEQIYNEITENSQQGQFKLDTLINNLDLKNKNNDSLIQLFKAGKGNFKNYAIEKYKIDDFEAMATTTYTLIFSVNGKVEKYEFEYSRILKDIVKVTKRE